MSTKREPEGIPSGGQFARDRRAEAEVDLDAGGTLADLSDGELMRSVGITPRGTFAVTVPGGVSRTYLLSGEPGDPDATILGRIDQGVKDSTLFAGGGVSGGHAVGVIGTPGQPQDSSQAFARLAHDPAEAEMAGAAHILAQAREDARTDPGAIGEFKTHTAAQYVAIMSDPGLLEIDDEFERMDRIQDATVGEELVGWEEISHRQTNGLSDRQREKALDYFAEIVASHNGTAESDAQRTVALSVLGHLSAYGTGRRSSSPDEHTREITAYANRNNNDASALLNRIDALREIA